MKGLSLSSSLQGFGFHLWRTKPVSDLGGGFLLVARYHLTALQHQSLSAIIQLDLKGQVLRAIPCIMVTASHWSGFVVDDEIDVSCPDLTGFDACFWAISLWIRPRRGRFKTQDERRSLSGLHSFGLANTPHVRGVWWWQFLLDQDLFEAFMAGLLRPGKDHPHNNRKLVTVDLGQLRYSVKPDVYRVRSSIVAEVCDGGALSLSCFDKLKWCVVLGYTNLWVALFWVPIVGRVQGAKRPWLIWFCEFGILVEDMVF